LRIGIDVESGESPFQELVKGSLKSIQHFSDIIVYIIGNSNNIIKKFPFINKTPNITLVDAKEVISMDEKPTIALKKKKFSTVSVGINLLKNNEIDVFFSPGNTGATVVSAVLSLRMIDGIKKPAMATFFPRIGGGETLIIDIGANPEANENDLYNNAIMGKAYFNLIWDKKDPTVGLLNMGVESGKGSVEINKAYEIMKEVPNFIGNVEGYNVFNGSVDVVVCNGFLGNSILKIAEATRKYFIYTLRKSLSNDLKISKFDKFLLYIFNLSKIYKLKKKIITNMLLPKYYGAVPLLGVKGLVMIGHGSCNSTELYNAIELIRKLYSLDFINKVIDYTKKMIKKY
jgi:glycerol-3-phosphate acyltransferase PlsX